MPGGEIISLKISKLEFIRNNSGKANTKGLTDETIKIHYNSSKDLKLAINDAHKMHQKFTNDSKNRM